jgi:AMMECR1 domain-containing protein
MKSKKKLFEALTMFFQNGEYIDKGLAAAGIRNETYGRKSCIYIDTKDQSERKNLEGCLGMKGFKVNREYWPGSAVLEVQVSYFKGENWNE